MPDGHPDRQPPLRHVHLGAGKLGLGYVLWARAPGVHTTLVSRFNPEKVDISAALGQDRAYLVESSTGYRTTCAFDDFVMLGPETAAIDALSVALAETDVLTVSVGAKNLPMAAHQIAGALRRARRSRPLVLLAVENVQSSSVWLAQMIRDASTGRDVCTLLPCNAVVDRKCTSLAIEGGCPVVHVEPRDGSSLQILVAGDEAREVVSRLFDFDRAGVEVMRDEGTHDFLELRKAFCVNALDYAAGTYAYIQDTAISEAMKLEDVCRRLEGITYELAVALTVEAIARELEGEYPFEANLEYARESLEKLRETDDIYERVFGDLKVYANRDRILRDFLGTIEDDFRSLSWPSGDNQKEEFLQGSFRRLIRKGVTELVQNLDLGQHLGKVRLRLARPVRVLCDEENAMVIERIVGGPGFVARHLPTALSDHIRMMFEEAQQSGYILAQVSYDSGVY